MDLKSYLAILKGNKWIILGTMLVTVLVATVITLMITPTYTASTTLRVATASSGVVGYSDYMYADRLMNTYIRLATSRPVLQDLAGVLNLQTLPEFKVEIIPNTELIRISVESSDPVIAERAANTLSQIMILKGKELYSGGGKSTLEILANQIQLTETELTEARAEYEDYLTKNPNDTVRQNAMTDAIEMKEKTYGSLLEQYDAAQLRDSMRANIISSVEPAVVPMFPSKPNRVMNIGLGILMGAVGGVGLAFFFESLGSRLYSSRQIEAATGLSPIGKIPAMPRKTLLNRWVKDFQSPRSSFRESFRRLHVHLLMQSRNTTPDGEMLKTCLITSAEPGEGKSLISMNLAMAMAQAGKKVLVVDCDLHIPKQHKINGLPNKVGLSSLLSQKASIEEAVQQTHIAGMHVLTSGPLPHDPAKMIAGMQMKALVNALSECYDIVLLDSPALLVLADTALLVPLVDGVIYVARRNVIKEEAVREAIRQLQEAHAPLLGVVVNDAERNGSYYYDRER